MTRPLAPLHLGDGAYVCDEHGSVVLRAGSHRAEDCTDEIWLGPTESLRLHDWLGQWFAAQPIASDAAKASR